MAAEGDYVDFGARQQIARLEKDMTGLKGGGGSGSDGMLEARLSKVEAHVDHIRADVGGLKTGLDGLRGEARTDFRLLFGAIIAVALGLAGLMAKGFHWF